MPQTLTDDNFDSALAQSTGIYAVRFGAKWCGPCKAMSSVFAATADEMQGTARFAEVDIDQSPQLTDRYGLRSIPAVLLFEGGEVIDRMSGVTAKPDFIRFINNHVS